MVALFILFLCLFISYRVFSIAVYASFVYSKFVSAFLPFVQYRSACQLCLYYVCVFFSLPCVQYRSICQLSLYNVCVCVFLTVISVKQCMLALFILCLCMCISYRVFSIAVYAGFVYTTFVCVHFLPCVQYNSVCKLCLQYVCVSVYILPSVQCSSICQICLFYFFCVFISTVCFVQKYMLAFFIQCLCVCISYRDFGKAVYASFIYSMFMYVYFLPCVQYSSICWLCLYYVRVCAFLTVCSV